MLLTREDVMEKMSVKVREEGERWARATDTSDTVAH